jgi:ubiquinone/menaquinone biosynthesis C-methylase UbiE
LTGWVGSLEVIGVRFSTVSRPTVACERTLGQVRDPVQENRFAEHVKSILAEYERRRREIPADFYSPLRLPNLFIHTQRKRSLLHLLRKENIATLSGREILDVGCGSGAWLLDFLLWGATPERLCGIDIDEHEIAEAARKLPRADLRVGNAAALPWPDDHFDIVVQATLFSSILDAHFKETIAGDIVRVTKPGGLILWYDLRLNNPRNPAVRGIGARELRRLFPGCPIRLKRMTLLPPLARKVVPVSWTAAMLLEVVPLLRSHILAIIRVHH